METWPNYLWRLLHGLLKSKHVTWIALKNAAPSVFAVSVFNPTKQRRNLSSQSRGEKFEWISWDNVDKITAMQSSEDSMITNWFDTFAGSNLRKAVIMCSAKFNLKLILVVFFELSHTVQSPAAFIFLWLQGRRKIKKRD